MAAILWKIILRDRNFHDTDGPGFLLCCYASDGHPNMGIVMENCVINAKSKRPLQPRVRAAIINTTDWTEASWIKCRFYLSKGEGIMAVMDREKDKRSTFKDCFVKNLSAAGSSLKHPAKMTEIGRCGRCDWSGIPARFRAPGFHQRIQT